MAMPGASGNAKLSALWIVDPQQAAKIAIKALQMSNGNICRAAKLLKVSRNTFKTWMTKNPEIRIALNLIKAKG
jgi:transcriptional regulator of acetoin/glycerol metabolism